MDLFDEISFKISELVTKTYSTSFSIAVNSLSKEMKSAIFSIYGFVRFADEIVDTFTNVNQQLIIDNFQRDYFEAITNGIGVNPILNCLVIKKNGYNS